MPPGSYKPTVFCIGFRGKSRRAQKKNWAYLLYSSWIASHIVPEWSSRSDYQIQLRTVFVDVECHVSAYCIYPSRRQQQHNHVGYILCLAAGSDLEWFSPVHPPSARRPSQCSNSYYRDHVFCKECIGAWVDTCFKTSQRLGSGFFWFCFVVFLCVCFVFFLSHNIGQEVCALKLL